MYGSSQKKISVVQETYTAMHRKESAEPTTVLPEFVS